ncbi:MAG: acyltransferase [Robiginitomaculum sp.]|nr:acyltransferase [Robiginitomaculum sp.]
MQKNVIITRLDSIRALRGIAVLLVLASHLLIIERKYSNDQILPDWLINGLSGVDLFFVISGFIMVYVTQNTRVGWQSSWLFLLARITRIYPLYWVVSLSLVFVWLIVPHMVFSSTLGQPNFFRSFLLLPDQQPPLLAVGWTLIHEMYFYLIFALGLLLPRKYLIWFLLLVSVVAVLGYWQYSSRLSALTSLILSPLIIEFLGGAMVAFAVIRWKVHFWQILVFAGVTLFLLTLIYASYNSIEEFWVHSKRALFFAPSASLLVYGLVVMEQNGKSFSTALIWIGDQSYSLYLTHVLTLSVVGWIWGWFAVPGYWDNIIALPILVISSLIVGQITYVLLERPMLRGAYWLRHKLDS